jgi:hypothetical protein
VIGGAAVVGLRTLGEDAKATFDTLNRTFEDSVPGEGKASSQDVEDWIVRYRRDARGVVCEKDLRAWDFVCVFKNSKGRRLKMGVMVNWSQPIQMSPVVKLRRPLPRPA